MVPERSALADFHAAGARPVRIQLAANPRIYRPYPEPRIYDVTFVGQRYADRADFLGHLRANGVDVRAWGAGWQSRKRLDLANAKAALALIEDERLDGLRRLVRQRLADGSRPPTPETKISPDEKDFASGVPVSPGDRKVSASGTAMVAPEVDTSAFGGPRLLQHDLIKMFSRSRLSLGFATAGDSHLGPARLTHLRLREFEAPMSGALYLTEDQPELAEYFDPGAEVLTYTDRDDLLDKARYYLAHPEQSERIRHAGLLRARATHTWQHRFGELFAALGLRARS
jgi:spore maturation protein CgeB